MVCTKEKILFSIKYEINNYTRITYEYLPTRKIIIFNKNDGKEIA